MAQALQRHFPITLSTQAKCDESFNKGSAESVHAWHQLGDSMPLKVSSNLEILSVAYAENTDDHFITHLTTKIVQ